MQIWTGRTCSQAFCPRGDNPFTFGQNEIQQINIRYEEKKKQVHRLIKEAMAEDEKHKLQVAREKGKCSREMWEFIKKPGDRDEHETKIKIKIDNIVTTEENSIKNEIEKYWREMGNINIQRPEGGWKIRMNQKQTNIF